MKRVVSKVCNQYASIPTWTLKLSCGHETTFSARDRKDVSTRPPESVECPQCDRVAEQTNENENNDQSKPMKKDTIPLAIGSIVLIAGHQHICDKLGKKCRLIPLDARTVADATEPYGYRTLGKAILESPKLKEVFFKSPGSNDTVKQRDEAWLKEFLADQAVSAEEAAKIEAASKPAKATAKPKPAAKAKPAAKPGAAKKDKPVPAATSRTRMEKIFGHSVCSVIRSLGKAGATVAEARVIMEKKGVEVKDTTLSLNVGAGRAGKYGDAGLDRGQLAELLALKPAPAAK